VQRHIEKIAQATDVPEVAESIENNLEPVDISKKKNISVGWIQVQGWKGAHDFNEPRSLEGKCPGLAASRLGVRAAELQVAHMSCVSARDGHNMCVTSSATQTLSRLSANHANVIISFLTLDFRLLEGCLCPEWHRCHG